HLGGLVDRLGGIDFLFHQSSLEHAKRAQPRRVAALHCCDHFLLHLIDKGHDVCYSRRLLLTMYIKKQRLLTPGPTPLYPPALHAMMRSDMHHRTEDFRKVYRACLADLKEVMGTANDVLMFAASGTGAMDGAVSNLFSKGDKVIVCVAGKFGERWADIVKSYGLDANVITVPYGQVVKPEQVEAALKAEPATKGVFAQASETSTGAAHDIEAMGRAIAKTDAIFVVDCITGLGTMPLDIDGWGLDVAIGGSQKAFMVPPGLAFMSVSPKAWKLGESSNL